jgi:chromosome segregation ATPase
MMPSPDRPTQLSRMEEARRQTQRQLDLIERQITRRMTALIPQLLPRRTAYRRGKPPDPGAFLERYRSNLAAATAERQAEIDALSRKLARQDRAISALRERFDVRSDPAASSGEQPHTS